MDKYLIFDGHLDLAMNAMEWNRDLRRTTAELRRSEEGMKDKPDREKGTVSFPSMREGRIGICVATQIARVAHPGQNLPGWSSPEQAWAHTTGQLAWYRAMEEAGELVHILSAADLQKHLLLWREPPADAPIGYVLSLEGADSIISIDHLEKAYDYGLRAIGPAHYGPGIYAHGTDSSGGLGSPGKELLKHMDRLGIILDATHLSDQSFREAMDIFQGAVWASHSNCRKFVPHNRQFTDGQIRELIQRDAVIGAALDAWMMVPDWKRGESDPGTMGVTLKLLVNNVDHICQLSGNSLHAAIGSDLDGGFGKEQSPADIDTIADLQKIPLLLKEIGYGEEDIENVMSNNWIRFLDKNLPQA
jgi:membrane dipeptidase